MSRRRTAERTRNERRLVAPPRRRFDAIAPGLLGAVERLVDRGQQLRVVLAGLGNHCRDADAQTLPDDAAGEAQLREAFAHPGPALVDVTTTKQELVMPPTIKAEQAKGFSLFMLKAILNGRGDEIVELARTNLRR